jgi:hypothetical protein
MSKAEKAGITLIAALIAGAIVQNLAKQEAAILGLSALEVALLSAGAGALVARKAS